MARITFSWMLTGPAWDERGGGKRGWGDGVVRELGAGRGGGGVGETGRLLRVRFGASVPFPPSPRPPLPPPCVASPRPHPPLIQRYDFSPGTKRWLRPGGENE